MKIYISSDHGGFELKNQLLESLEIPEKYSGKENGIFDLGPFEYNKDDDFPDFAKLVCEKIQNEKDSLGILICKSGIGMSIAANKYKGCYAALCFSPLHAQKAKEDDNANILCIGADYDGEDANLIAQSFINTEFDSSIERFQRRFEKVQKIENEN